MQRVPAPRGNAINDRAYNTNTIIVIYVRLQIRYSNPQINSYIQQRVSHNTACCTSLISVKVNIWAFILWFLSLSLLSHFPPPLSLCFAPLLSQREQISIELPISDRRARTHTHTLRAHARMGLKVLPTHRAHHIFSSFCAEKAMSPSPHAATATREGDWWLDVRCLSL